MINSVYAYELDSIFKKDASFCYIIPKYQREYTWSHKEWKDLYDDLSENDFGYFIGSIICINTGSNANNITQYEVIDGQQRLTTLSLLLAALYKQFKIHKSELDEENEDEPSSLKKSLSIKGAPNDLILRPQSQACNLDDYLQVMHEAGELYKPDKWSRYSGIRRISKCYHYFENRILSDMEAAGDKHIEKLLDIRKHVARAVLVKIEVSSHSDAFTLFESLNNRGTPLTAVDLMKNLILSQAEKVGLSFDECFETWQQLLKYLTDDYATQERFFRQYYNAFKTKINDPFRDDNDRRKDPLGYIATRSNLLSIFERVIGKNLSAFLDDVIVCGQLYSLMILSSEEKTPYAKSLADLYHIQGVPSYVLLLYLFRYQSELKLSQQQLNTIIRYLTCYFVRRNITDYPTTSSLQRLFMTMNTTIASEGIIGDELVEFVHKTLIDNSASEQTLIERLHGDIYIDNAYAVRFLLSSLAQSHMTKETQVDLWEQSIYSNGQRVYLWTIEHIFPEGENIPKPWIDMIANGDAETAKEYRAKYVHKLGNLTLTRYNTELFNYSFEKKRDRKNQAGSFIGYKNGFSINSIMAAKESWTISDIEDRTELLISELLTMFHL